MASNVTVITVTRGTSVTVFFAFTKPTRSSYPNVSQVAGDPSTVKLTWRWQGGSETSYTYGTGATITRLGTGIYVAAISTKTPPSAGPASPPTITGKVIGTGTVTATGQFQIVVDPLNT